MASLLALAALPGASFAQKPDSGEPALRLKVEAREVVLPVTVRDRKGALVASLQRSDFTLTEDGRPQTIKSFTREAGLPFRLGLLVDTSRSLSGAIESERKAAGKFVDQMLPGEPGTDKKAAAGKDEAFLLHFDREVELLEDFTGSREKLHKELDEMGPSRGARDDPGGPETSDDERTRTRGGRGGTQLYDAIFLASDELMRPRDGRKALVVFSDGLDRGSKDSMNDAVDAADRANVAVYTIYFKGVQERRESNFPEMGDDRRGGGYPGGGGGYPGGGRWLPWRRRLSGRRRAARAGRRRRAAARGGREKDLREDCGAHRGAVLRSQKEGEPGRDL